MADFVPAPLSPDLIVLITIVIGFVLTPAASVVCWLNGSTRVKKIAGAWLSFSFTATPLVLLCLNSLLTMLHIQMGVRVAETTNFGVGPAAIGLSVGYALIHLVSDLSENIKPQGKPKVARPKAVTQ